MVTSFTHGIYCVDLEFHPVNGIEGNPPEPVCMVVRNLVTGNPDGHPNSPTYGHLKSPTLMD